MEYSTVELPQKGYRLDILNAALIIQPVLTSLLLKIETNHAGDRIDAKTVKVVNIHQYKALEMRKERTSGFEKSKLSVPQPGFSAISGSPYSYSGVPSNIRSP